MGKRQAARRAVRTISRDVANGRFVPKAMADRFPRFTTTETVGEARELRGRLAQAEVGVRDTLELLADRSLDPGTARERAWTALDATREEVWPPAGP